jgi:hypothetical protein
MMMAMETESMIAMVVSNNFYQWFVKNVQIKTFTISAIPIRIKHTPPILEDQI